VGKRKRKWSYLERKEEEEGEREGGMEKGSTFKKEHRAVARSRFYL
jgi:hypothetical protein